MSCSSWESGSLIIPTASWMLFKKQIVDEYNRKLECEFNKIKHIHETLSAMYSGKRNVDWLSAVSTLVKNYSGWDILANNSLDNEEVGYLLSKFLLKQKNGKYSLVSSIMKSKFPFVKASSKSFVLETSLEDYSISFNQEKKQVTWHVFENNHAVEEARASFLGKLFFRKLDLIQWKKNTGGMIVMNHENNWDDHSVGGGGNIVSGFYGYIGLDEKIYQYVKMGFSEKEATSLAKKNLKLK